MSGRQESEGLPLLSPALPLTDVQVLSYLCVQSFCVVAGRVVLSVTNKDSRALGEVFVKAPCWFFTVVLWAPIEEEGRQSVGWRHLPCREDTAPVRLQAMNGREGTCRTGTRPVPSLPGAEHVSWTQCCVQLCALPPSCTPSFAVFIS